MDPCTQVWIAGWIYASMYPGMDYRIDLWIRVSKYGLQDGSVDPFIQVWITGWIYGSVYPGVENTMESAAEAEGRIY